jgi:predicted XRE-type DNA-binding protein
MKSEELEVVRGSGNVFRDLGYENADVEHLKAVLAAEIIQALDREGLSVRAAHSRTGVGRPTSRAFGTRTSVDSPWIA